MQNARQVASLVAVPLHTCCCCHSLLQPTAHFFVKLEAVCSDKGAVLKCCCLAPPLQREPQLCLGQGVAQRHEHLHDYEQRPEALLRLPAGECCSESLGLMQFRPSADVPRRGCLLLSCYCTTAVVTCCQYMLHGCCQLVVADSCTNIMPRNG